MPVPTDHHALANCHPTFMPAINKQCAISKEYIDPHLGAVSSAIKDNGFELNTTDHFHGSEETEQNLPQIGKTLRSMTRAHDSSEVNNRESNESRVQSNSKPKVRPPQLNKKHQIILSDVGPKRAVSGKKRKPMAKPGQNRVFDGEHKCKLCRYATNTKASLTIHMRAHTGEKPYQCQMCNYASTQLSTLKEHVRIHTGEKPYKCRFCEYTTAHHSNLALQKRTHSGEKPYKCRLCNYAATQSHSLIEHIRIHTGEKPYNCRLCQFASRQTSGLNQHMRTQHNGTLKLYTASSKHNALNNALNTS